MLFSEPKIPQSCRDLPVVTCISVSVLFSEPKIPQLLPRWALPAALVQCFSALQRAENSSIQTPI